MNTEIVVALSGAIGTLVGGGGLGVYLKFKNDQIALLVNDLNERIDKQDKKLLEADEKLARAEAKIETQAGHINDQKAKIQDLWNHLERFEDRILWTIKYRPNDPEAWKEIEQEIRAARAKRAGVSPVSTHGRVLIVDDEIDTHGWVTLALRDMGLETASAYGADEALLKWEAALQAGLGFDVLLLDYQMPNKNGLEVASDIRRIESERNRQRGGGPQVGIILFTGNGGDVKAEDMARVHASYLGKPVAPADLKIAVSEKMPALST